MKLLLVEDNPADADFLAASLRRQRAGDIELVNVQTLAEATAQLGLDKYDVVLLDLHLPDGSGLQCLDSIQAVDNEIPIVVLSGQDDEEFAVSILNKGAQDYLVKWEGQGRTILRSIRYAIERKKSDLRLSYLAQYDPLTGIPNRQFFNDQLTRATARARRDGRKVTLLFLDLDEFKVVNDTLGHDTGDRLLKEVADRIRRTVRTGDVVARLGGDEFAVLLEGLSGPREVEAVATGLLDIVSRPYHIAERQLTITTSIGITMYPNDNADTQMLLKNADIAMYRAKDLGKNTYQFYSADMSARAFERLTLESSLRHAIERNEFRLYYQPQIDTASGAILGVEALLRWQHPDFGLVAPAEFIPLLEETGLIVPAGDWVLHTACEQLRAWHVAGWPRLRMAVNLSPRQFQATGLAETVKRGLFTLGCDPGLLELELTESVLLRHTAATLETLEALHALGVRMAIDDFGTGYSSLSYLRRYSIDTLKIDRSFVHDVPGDADDSALASAIIVLAQSLKLDVIAEGVETEAQRDFLRERGCHQMQGYLFSRPLPAGDITPLLEKAGPQMYTDERGRKN